MISYQAKPFLKWAGGKGRLLEQMIQYLPIELKQGLIQHYVEPFVGSGAFFIYLVQIYDIQSYFISDINEELIIAYKTIQKDVDDLIELLLDLQAKYLSLNEIDRKEYYYHTRNLFNEQKKFFDFQNYTQDWIYRAAQIIFLNRTCFNGLFRVNSKGEFNVPIGKYTNPLICNASNLQAVSQILQKTHIEKGDFTQCENWVDKQTFVYFDPPYLPISKTSYFTSYSQQNFDTAEQLRLCNFYKKLSQKGAKLMLSNSDPQNEHLNDNFFEIAYKDYNIKRILASRNINSNSQKRGKITELLIMNY